MHRGKVLPCPLSLCRRPLIFIVGGCFGGFFSNGGNSEMPKCVIMSFFITSICSLEALSCHCFRKKFLSTSSRRLRMRGHEACALFCSTTLSIQYLKAVSVGSSRTFFVKLFSPPSPQKILIETPFESAET